jgi:enoyl-CoA hydratase/carnithine racemase
VGLSSGYGSCQKLIRLVGKSLVQKYFFLDPIVRANIAVQQNLIHEVCASPNELQLRYSELVQTLAGYDHKSLATQKAMIHLDSASHRKQQIEELRLFKNIWMNPTHKQTLSKFLKK